MIFPAWGKGLFVTIKDLCTVTRPGFITADEFIESHTRRKHIHNPGYLDYLEILKLVPKDWQNKIKQNTALPEKDTVKVMVFSSKRKWQEKNIAETQCKHLYFTLHQKKINHNFNGINMKIGNSNIIRRSLHKSNANNFSLVSTRIRNRNKKQKTLLNPLKNGVNKTKISDNLRANT